MDQVNTMAPEDFNGKQETLKQIVSIWEKAISTLRAVGPNSQKQGEATEKLAIYEPRMQYAEALQLGFTNAVRSQARDKNDAAAWEIIISRWQQAIAQLESVLAKLDLLSVTDEKFYAQVKDKIAEYKGFKNEAYETKTLAPLYLAVTKANEADVLRLEQTTKPLGTEQSSKAWLNIAILWKEAAELAEQVKKPKQNSTGTEQDSELYRLEKDRYELAQQKTKEYSKKYVDARRYSDQLAAAGE